ncbi:MAG: acyl-CoA reductase, partial [Bacteroidales bacterium]|nr:acyl-CoA reductase [Bacteroidales bacterium]
MILLAKRLGAFERLGQLLKNDAKHIKSGEKEAVLAFENARQKAMAKNAWFTADNISLMVENIADMISAAQLKYYADAYNLESVKTPKTVAVIMAGNIPLVGFHDFFVVLASGHKFLGKLSSDDLYLLPALAAILIAIEPEFKAHIAFSEGIISNFDAVIATGSDNT